MLLRGPGTPLISCAPELQDHPATVCTSVQLRLHLPVAAPGADTEGAAKPFSVFTVLRCKVGSHSHPNPPQSSPLPPPRRLWRRRPVSTGASWHEMTSSLQRGLAALVWLLKPFSPEMPPSYGCSYTLHSTERRPDPR